MKQYLFSLPSCILSNDLHEDFKTSATNIISHFEVRRINFVIKSLYES